ncbi:hypothetical protein GJR96_00630 [Haloferax sp. MBLA0076]|uniref:RNA polymerase sigma factor 70 region 1.1 domain-containing protein n=1 Tax=Haloferax litoreum TaxID=2666140 RepID=A0A6A8GB59_9EURY|nr:MULTISPECIES: RNA polymerase sigma factor region1.1 domain-containing protein [Haloferax]KAB1192022.1 hypothetical protein Hfx1148_00630 [Haloferax sp. CBA1148]MRX20464.1 hypothetical protein [Haloferax litoreum]
MRIRDTEARKARFDELMMASPENTKSKAIDRAVEFYIAMAGAHRDGQLEQLLARAKEQGSVTPEEIAEVLDTDYLPVRAETAYSVGEE